MAAWSHTAHVRFTRPTWSAKIARMTCALHCMTQLTASPCARRTTDNEGEHRRVTRDTCPLGPGAGIPNRNSVDASRPSLWNLKHAKRAIHIDVYNVLLPSAAASCVREYFLPQPLPRGMLLQDGEGMFPTVLAKQLISCQLTGKVQKTH